MRESMNKLNLILSIFFVSLNLQAQVTSSSNNNVPPKAEAQIPIVDPFARNVVRPTQYGSVPVVKSKSDKKTDIQGIDFSYRYDDDFARLPDLRNYRVISITAKSVSKSPLMFGPNLSEPGLGTSARRIYLRIAKSSKLLLAKQYVWDTFEQNKNFMDANFVIRSIKEGKETSYVIDMGPFVNERHALLFCTHLLPELNNECVIDRNFQTRPEHQTFKNTATLGLSNSMIQQILSTNKQQDAANLYSSGFDVQEGETLGKNNFVVLKINAKGVYLGGETGKLFLLPSDIVPSPYSGDEVLTEK
jgi:hypothetical protein